MELLNLGRLSAFRGVAEHFVQNLEYYRKYFDSSDPHRDPLVGEWDTKLSQFQKMLFLRCIRVDKALLAIAVCNFINIIF
jgi:dynein heavy chain